ncbi:MAG TPA: hypothetical protein VMU50_16080, partial [Polyangia bacterium]|nr:hypothetical protein [Polyangia bacterium]
MIDGDAVPASIAVASALRAADLPEETIYLAGDAASAAWTPDLPEADRRAWTLLVAASLEAQRRGDTRLALPRADAAGASFLYAFLALPELPDADRRGAMALAARLRGERPHGLGEIVGAPGEYKPFIVDGGCLYHQRVLAVEEKLAAALRRRRGQRASGVSETALAEAVAAAA